MSRIEVFCVHIKKKRFVIILNVFSLALLFILFWYFTVPIDNIITIMLTYVLAMATGYYAIVNSRMFRMAEEDRKFEIKPQFAWTLYKYVHGAPRRGSILDLFVTLQNIGRGAAKEIELEIVLSKTENEVRTRGYQRLRIDPMLAGEKKWIHINGYPPSMPDYSEEDNAQEKGGNDILAIFISYQDVNGRHYPLASALQTTGRMKYIAKDQMNKIYKEAHENHCFLEEKDEGFIKEAKRHREKNEEGN